MSPYHLGRLSGRGAHCQTLLENFVAGFGIKTTINCEEVQP